MKLNSSWTWTYYCMALLIFAWNGMFLTNRCMYICFFKAEIDLPDPNVERSKSLRLPVKGERTAHIILHRYIYTYFILSYKFVLKYFECLKKLNIFILNYYTWYTLVVSSDSQMINSFLTKLFYIFLLFFTTVLHQIY